MQKLKEDEAQQMLVGVEGWCLEGDMLKKDFGFKGFSTAINFINLLVPVANKLSHYPTIINSYNRVTVSLTSYAAHGLTKMDFKFATEADKIADELRK
jgi:4a-hydroxytetrahydrobiopterin dehydratase